GSTYAATAAPDFLTANDAWFMPVVQKTGPDGCLYILDWYDRYHCYQDARRDPQGIDRLKGRLYRVRYENAPRAPRFDLAKETDEQLIERLHSPNVFYRELAQRILCERNDAQTRPKLERLILDVQAPRKARMHALWALVGTGALATPFHQALLEHQDAGYRAWGLRAAGNFGKVDPAVRAKIVSMTADPAADVRLQVAIAARKIAGLDAMPMLIEVLTASAGDELIGHVVWQNLHPLLENEGSRYLQLVAQDKFAASPAVASFLPRVIDRILGSREPANLVALVKSLSADVAGDTSALEKCFATLTTRLETRELAADQLAELRGELDPLVQKILSQPKDDSPYANAALLAATWKDPAALVAVRSFFTSQKQPLRRRSQALDALVAAQDATLEASVAELFAQPHGNPVELRAAALDSLSRVDAPWVARVILTNYPKLEPELKPRAIEVLTERRAWAGQLLDAIGRDEIPATALNANQVRQLIASGDASLVAKVHARWGSLRDSRDPKREEVIARMRPFLRKTPGDPHAGKEVYARVCGQCHKLHGLGQDVGPDITLNGRSSFEQLLSNVFDPSLVIGAAYQARTIVTEDGRVLTGLVVEDGQERVVLKMQGGKQETVPQAEIAEMKTSTLSLMPEDLEKQLKEQELADLFAYITL
ncbi:MAG: c-type cytochrome, partial [Pirellulales bacterium]